MKLTATALGNSALSLSDHTIVRARAIDGGEWSALNEAFYTVGGSEPVAPGEVVISEIHYNPTGADDPEFLELHNSGPTPLELGGFFFDGITFTFPASTSISPGATPIASAART